MRRTARKATIADVARLAGVSTATVSRSLSAPMVVSEETRGRVAEAVAQTGYIANSAAQMLRSRRAGAVLVAVPDLGNTFFSELIAGMEAVARAHGVAVLVADVQRGGGSGARLARLLDAGRADGALVLHGALLPGGPGCRQVTVAEELAETRPGIAHVGIDNAAAARDATEHLIALGHRAIVHLTGPETTILTRQRIAGYRAAMEAAGLAGQIRLLPGDFTIASGQQAAGCLAPALPDAVVSANDEMAIGLMNGLAARGIAVPRDLSVIGLDDIAFAAHAHPALTTIRQPRAEIGRLAMEELLRQIDGAAPTPPIRIAHMLVPRASTAPR